MILLAILFPPAYFLMRQKIGMCLITGVMFVVSCFLALTVVMIPGSLIMWLIAAFAALRDQRRVEQASHADMLASKMADKMAQKTAQPDRPPVLSQPRE